MLNFCLPHKHCKPPKSRNNVTSLCMAYGRYSINICCEWMNGWMSEWMNGQMQAIESSDL
jgi:hypothetical protein